MKTLLFIGGPLIATIGFGFYSGLLEFAHNLEGIEYEAGVEAGGTFGLIEREEVYQCDEGGNNCVLIETNTEFSEIDGLELEEEAIEYRNGSEDTIVRKQPGIAKYANITMRRPTGFDWKTWRFMFEREAAIQRVKDEYDQKLKDMQTEEAKTKEEEGEMYQIEPPVLVIPAG